MTILAAPRRAAVDVQPTTEQLLSRYDHMTADNPERARVRARVIEKNLPMAHQLARRYAGRGEQLEDLSQVAAMALIRAVDGFDSSRQVPFAGYAVPSILGALKRHFRDATWAMRVPRSAQELAHTVTSATGELSQRIGRTPTHTELAAHLRVSTQELLAAVIAGQAYHLASLNMPRAGTEVGDLIDVVGGIDPGYEWVEDHLALQPLFAALAPRERRILTMRFYGQLTQTEIAAAVGLSQMHVSRLLRKALDELRSGLE